MRDIDTISSFVNVKIELYNLRKICEFSLQQTHEVLLIFFFFTKKIKQLS
jgi:hypothetical protein